MKQNIHPAYYPNAKIKCACGNAWTTGSTLPELNVEICSQCHPFYSGKEKILDTRGRVEKFNKRLSKTAETRQQIAPKQARAKKQKTNSPTVAKAMVGKK